MGKITFLREVCRTLEPVLRRNLFDLRRWDRLRCTALSLFLRIAITDGQSHHGYAKQGGPAHYTAGPMPNRLQHRDPYSPLMVTWDSFCSSARSVYFTLRTICGAFAPSGRTRAGLPSIS